MPISLWQGEGPEVEGGEGGAEGEGGEEGEGGQEAGSAEG